MLFFKEFFREKSPYFEPTYCGKNGHLLRDSLSKIAILWRIFWKNSHFQTVHQEKFPFSRGLHIKNSHILKCFPAKITIFRKVGAKIHVLLTPPHKLQLPNSLLPRVVRHTAHPQWAALPLATAGGDGLTQLSRQKLSFYEAFLGKNCSLFAIFIWEFTDKKLLFSDSSLAKIRFLEGFPSKNNHLPTIPWQKSLFSQGLLAKIIVYCPLNKKIHAFDKCLQKFRFLQCSFINTSPPCVFAKISFF